MDVDVVAGALIRVADAGDIEGNVIAVNGHEGAEVDHADEDMSPHKNDAFREGAVAIPGIQAP